MVQEVMGQIIADIPKDTAAENSSCRMPIPIDDCMSKLVERRSQDHEESRWHHQAQLVHRQIVMDAMQQKVSSYTDTIVREVPIMRVT